MSALWCSKIRIRVIYSGHLVIIANHQDLLDDSQPPCLDLVLFTTMGMGDIQATYLGQVKYPDGKQK